MRWPIGQQTPPPTDNQQTTSLKLTNEIKEKKWCLTLKGTGEHATATSNVQAQVMSSSIDSALLHVQGVPYRLSEKKATAPKRSRQVRISF